MGQREQLPYLEVVNWASPEAGGGIYTKNSNELVRNNHLREAENTDFFSSYGAVSKPPGMSRVLAAQYTEGSAAPISWVGFYKAAGLDGQILRHVLIAAGTTMQRVETDGTLTQLTGGGDNNVTESRTSGLFHSSGRFGDLMFIVNQDPELIGNGNTPLKYDGNDIHRWGVVAPGSTETVREAFSDASSFTATRCTVTDEATVTRDGSSVKVTKTSTSNTSSHIQKTLGSTFSVNTTIANRAKVWLFIPRGQLSNFAQTNSVQVLVGSDANLSDNFYTFSWDIGQLIEGWNELGLDFSDATVGVQTGSPVASALQTIRFLTNSVTTGTLISNIRWDRFVTLDTGAATTAEGASGSVFTSGSDYDWRITFVSKYGHESNAGPRSVSLTTTQAVASLELTAIPISSDPQVIARKIYRTVGDGSINLLVDTINDNITTTYSDTTADTALGQTSPPLEGDLSDDDSPPPDIAFLKVWKRTIFGSGNPAAPENVYFTEDDEGESWPTLNVVTLDAPVTGMYETYSGMVIETQTGKWQVSGDNPDFRFDKIINQIGNVGHRAAGDTRLFGWATDRDGMRLYDLNDVFKISEPIRDKFDDDFNKANLEKIHTTHSRNRNGIVMMAQDSSGVYGSQSYMYQYPIDVVLKGWWWQLVLPTSVDVRHITEIEDTDGTFKLYAAAADGMLYHLFDPDQKNWTDAGGNKQTITTKIVTKWFRLGQTDEAQQKQGATGRASPRLIEIRAAGDAATWTCLVETANGPDPTTVLASQTMTLAFAANESLLRVPVLPMQPGEYVRLTLTNSEQDVSSSLLAFRLYYFVQPGQFPVATGDLGG